MAPGDLLVSRAPRECRETRVRMALKVHVGLLEIQDIRQVASLTSLFAGTTFYSLR